MTAASDDRWIGRHEALTRLGVKAQTLYAYVSRGRIASRPDPNDSRRSLFAVSDIARLTGETIDDDPMPRFRSAPGAARGEADLESNLSAVIDGRLFYQGLDAVQLAENATVEEVARRLWNARDSNPFAGVRPRVGLTPGGSARARLFAALARRAEEDADTRDRSAGALTLECARVLDEAFDAVAGPGPRLFLHQRLARAWKAAERDGHLVRRALVLSADAGLDPAVLATRATAAGGASPAAAALAGVAVLTASDAMVEMARATAWIIAVRRHAADAARRAHEAGVLAGFGDPAWPHGDPRAAALTAATDLPPDIARAVTEGQAASGRPPAFPLALAIVARRLELPREGAADLYLLGRLTGLLGHALDQTINGSPIRARLRYVGPEPGAH